jgi:hypothetical protein
VNAVGKHAVQYRSGREPGAGKPARHAQADWESGQGGLLRTSLDSGGLTGWGSLAAATIWAQIGTILQPVPLGEITNCRVVLSPNPRGKSSRNV